MRATVERLGCTSLPSYLCSSSRTGVTCVLVLAESHLTISTWPRAPARARRRVYLPGGHRPRTRPRLWSATAGWPLTPGTYPPVHPDWPRDTTTDWRT
ncbi:MAG: S-adenosylmethionine decarboxylase [Haloechinothrix sp.]